MTSLERSLTSWRRYAGGAEPHVPVTRVTDHATGHHQELLLQTERLALVNLQAHERFCKEIEAFVKHSTGERSEELQQRVADYAGYLLRMYENTAARAVEKELFKLLNPALYDYRFSRGA